MRRRMRTLKEVPDARILKEFVFVPLRWGIPVTRHCAQI
jgi:hypothetical protein